MDDGFGVELEEDAGGGAGAEAEDGEGSRRDDGREGGEDVEVGVGEGFEEERDAVDVSGTVEEEEPGAAEWMVGFSRNLENADVVVSRLELDEELYVFHGDTVFLGFGFGYLVAFG